MSGSKTWDRRHLPSEHAIDAMFARVEQTRSMQFLARNTDAITRIRHARLQDEQDGRA